MHSACCNMDADRTMLMTGLSRGAHVMPVHACVLCVCVPQLKDAAQEALRGMDRKPVAELTF
jgi:hypothetical protein